MGYRFTEYGGRRFVAWEDLELILDGLELYLRDKTDPEFETEHHILDVYVGGSYNSINNSEGKLIEKQLKTWVLPAAKPTTQIPGLSFIWCPLQYSDG